MKAERLTSLLSNLKGKKSQAWLAKEMDVTPSRLGTYLRGEIEDISVDFLSHVADYMNIGLDELMRTLEGDSQRKTELQQEGGHHFVTFEDLTSRLDCLDAKDIAKTINYLSEKLIARLKE